MKQNLNSKTQIFENLEDASLKLVEVLPSTKAQDENWLIVAISLNAIKMAEVVANKLQLEYDILFFEHIFAPNNSHNPIAMVSELEEIVMNENLIESFDIHEEYIYGEAHRKYEEKILQKVYKYKKGELISSLKDRNILLIDDGCETGLTALTAIKTAIAAKAHNVFFSVPVIPANLESSLETSTDGIYTLYHIANFVDTDFYFKNKDNASSEEIKNILENSKYYLPFKKEIKTGEEQI